MPRNLSLSFLLIAILPLTACKTWYKAGANDEDLSADQQRCEAETEASTGKAFVECMQRAGWQYADLSATASDSQSVSPSLNEAGAAPSAVQGDAASASKATVTERGSPEATARTAASDEPEMPAQPRQPGGWIQFGGDAGQLKNARAACDESGAGSESFNECMRAKGWRRIRLTLEEPGDSD